MSCVILVAGLLGCSALTGPRPGPVPVSDDIALLVGEWFSLLEGREAGSRSIEGLVGQGSLDLALAESRIETHEDLRVWLEDFRHANPRVEHETGPLQIEVIADQLWQARFEVTRRSYDQEGASHIARMGHSWLIHSRENAPPLIVRIEEQMLVPFPGTGPQIVCY